MMNRIHELIGDVPKDKGDAFKRRMRLHQCWWRTFVLQEAPGPHPSIKQRTICNTIKGGRENYKNFLTPDVILAVETTLRERSSGAPGMIQEDRLFGNLLSSQPLCFNFFGFLKSKPDLSFRVLHSFFPYITEFEDVLFEYAPEERYLTDNSAFDVAFRVHSSERKGLIGFECKYTDDFSFQNSDTKIYYGDIGCPNEAAYTDVFNGSSTRFLADYYEYVRNKKFNQLFRNQLIAEALIQHEEYDLVKTGLFCHHDDQDAIDSGNEFKNMLNISDHDFMVVTYRDFIETVQQLDLEWDERIWSMMLWSRYCGMELSEYTNNL